jgi:hypothetical protein
MVIVPIGDDGLFHVEMKLSDKELIQIVYDCPF